MAVLPLVDCCIVPVAATLFILDACCSVNVFAVVVMLVATLVVLVVLVDDSESDSGIWFGALKAVVFSVWAVVMLFREFLNCCRYRRCTGLWRANCCNASSMVNHCLFRFIFRESSQSANSSVTFITNTFVLCLCSKFYRNRNDNKEIH